MDKQYPSSLHITIHEGSSYTNLGSVETISKQLLFGVLFYTNPMKLDT